MNLNLIYKTLDWGRGWSVDFNAGKTRLVWFDWSNNSDATDVMFLFLKKKSCFNMLWLTFSSILDWDSYIISIAKTGSKKI